MSILPPNPFPCLKDFMADKEFSSGKAWCLWMIQYFLLGSLSAVQKKLRKEDLDPREDYCEFAVKAVQRELKARGMKPLEYGDDTDHVVFVLCQLEEYKNARLRWGIQILKKECPATDHPDSEMSEAAFAGLMMRHRFNDCDALKEWWSKKAVSPNALNLFNRTVGDPKPAVWKNPALDSWLILVWPLVQSSAWNYATVQCLASIKFPELDDAKPLATAEDMSAHCRKTLGLRIKNPKGGRPANDYFDYDNLTPIQRCALELDASLPDNISFNKPGSNLSD